MQNIVTRVLDNFRTQVSLEPLKRGYGHTLGNAMRRVLLSSLTGAAPTELLIKGVKHEYSSIEGVQEDVINIILNLKGVRFILKGAATNVELPVNFKGPGVLRAKDIQLTHDVEVLNPEHVIANVTQAVSLEMTIQVSKGTGYVPAAQIEISQAEEEMGSQTKKKGSLDGNILFLDASFSPVLRVSYNVENARVEQRTDFDRLVIDLETNGTIAPEEAIRNAAQILQEQLSLFSGIPVGATVTPKLSKPVSIYDTSVDDLELTVRSANALKSENIFTVRDLLRLTDEDLMGMPNLGKRSIVEIRDALGAHDLALGMEIKD